MKVQTIPDAGAPGINRASRCDALVRLYAPAASTLVLVGETGTGKSHLAERIHQLSPRARHPFVDVSAAEIVESVAQSALFGHEKGAFTDARERHRGYFERAGLGTLVLDDLHLMPIPIQAMLLRALTRRMFTPVGAKQDLPLLCRIIVGVCAPLDELMRQGIVLVDLRYRLGHSVIPRQPLRERRDAVLPLARGFLERCPAETGVAGPSAFHDHVCEVLEAHGWPGNIRELKSVVETAFLNAQHNDCIMLEHLPDELGAVPRFQPYGCAERNARAIDWALMRTNGRIDLAAKLIGAHRNTVSKHVASRTPRAESLCAAPNGPGSASTRRKPEPSS